MASSSAEERSGAALVACLLRASHPGFELPMALPTCRIDTCIGPETAGRFFQLAHDIIRRRIVDCFCLRALAPFPAAREGGQWQSLGRRPAATHCGSQTVLAARSPTRRLRHQVLCRSFPLPCSRQEKVRKGTCLFIGNAVRNF